MASTFNVGVLVQGQVTSPRALCRHADLLSAFADGKMAECDETGEAYLSHFVFDLEMKAHYTANRQSVAGFAGPCCCRWLVLDLDRPDLAEALNDARKLVTFLHQRYPETNGSVPIWFSGSKGFHVAVELAHRPPPAVGFHRVARALAEDIACGAGVPIDRSVYDLAHIIRLPNTRHPRTGLHKRRIDSDALFGLNLEGILASAQNPSGDGIPAVKAIPARLVQDWQAAERAVAVSTEARTATRSNHSDPESRAPRYLFEFLRFGIGEGERHHTLFRCAAWLTEQGAPPSLCFALLTEAGCDVGLTPKDVERQIACGIRHARKQQEGTNDPPSVEEDDERWAIQHEGAPLPPWAMDFPFGLLAPQNEAPA